MPIPLAQLPPSRPLVLDLVTSQAPRQLMLDPAGARAELEKLKAERAALLDKQRAAWQKDHAAVYEAQVQPPRTPEHRRLADPESILISLSESLEESSASSESDLLAEQARALVRLRASTRAHVSTRARG